MLVSIQRPLGYGPSTLPLRQFALVGSTILIEQAFRIIIEHLPRLGTNFAVNSAASGQIYTQSASPISASSSTPVSRPTPV